jgi:hypothetical protein
MHDPSPLLPLAASFAQGAAALGRGGGAAADGGGGGNVGVMVGNADGVGGGESCFFYSCLELPCIGINKSASTPSARRPVQLQVIPDPAVPFHPAAVYKSLWTFQHMTSFVNAHIRKRRARRAKKLKADS